MADEPQPYPDPKNVQKLDPLGAIPRKQLIRIGIGIFAGVLIAVFFLHSPTPIPPKQVVSTPVPHIVQHDAPNPNQDRGIGQQDQHDQGPRVSNIGGGTPETHTETWVEQLLKKRHEKELEAAFSSSLVVPVSTTDTPKPPATSDAQILQDSRSALRNLQTIQNAVTQPQSSAVPAIPPSSQMMGPTTRTETPEQKAYHPPSELAYDPRLAAYWLPEGTVINAVLDSQIEGEMTGLVDAHVSMDVYVRNSRLLIVPKGSRLIGESQKVASVNQARLAVAFHAIQVYLPGAIAPYVISLDEVPGEDQTGGAGLRGKVNNHVFKILGASLAAGLVEGLSEGIGYGRGSNGVIIGLGQGGQNATSQLVSRYTNLMPTITIPAGQRIVVELTGDLKVPAYEDVLHETQAQN